MPDAAYAGALVAAIALLAAAGYGWSRRRAPTELVLAGLTAASLAVGAGYLASRHVSARGVLVEERGLTERQAARAIALLVSPTYLRAIGVEPEARSVLARGLTAEGRGDGAAIAYHVSGFCTGTAGAGFAPWATFLDETRGHIAPVLFAARLLAARDGDELQALATSGAPPLTYPARLLLREVIPELSDRFPAAAPILEDLRRAAGGAVTPPPAADP